MEVVEELKEYTKAVLKLNALEKTAQDAQKTRDKAWREFYLHRDIVNSKAAALGLDEDFLPPKKMKFENKEVIDLTK